MACVSNFKWPVKNSVGFQAQHHDPNMQDILTGRPVNLSYGIPLLPKCQDLFATKTAVQMASGQNFIPRVQGLKNLSLYELCQ
jgi:hypothetical protein